MSKDTLKKCPKCQKNKLFETEPWQTLCVNLISPYTIKGKDKSKIDFMCLTMIDPATGWFEIVTFLVVEKPLNKDGKMTCQETFDKASVRIARLVSKMWFS